MNRPLPSLACLGTALLVGWSVLVGCAPDDVALPATVSATVPAAPLEVEVAALERHQVPLTVQMTGTLYGVEEVALAAEVGGRLVAVEADLGDRVAPGTVLARIEPRDFELARDERAQALAQELSQFGLTELPPEDFDIEGLPSVVRARLERENAEQRYERSKSLADGRTAAISEQALADLLTSAEVAAAGLDLARLDARAGLAQARTLQAQLRQAERRLALTTVGAPPAARASSADREPTWAVAERLAVAGDFVGSGDVLYRLVATDPLVLRGSLPERHYGDIRVGQAVELVVAGQKPNPVGEVSRVSPAVDVATRSFAVEVRVPNPDDRLAPGAFAVAQITVGENSAFLAPARTVSSFAGVQRVFVARENKAFEERVQTGRTFGERVELLGELEAGAQLVLDPPSRMVDGTPIRVGAAAPAQGAP
ncbi:MAG: efflux RND transporter periplasmic adaptor subunit [Planctomycetaceae bacterium]|nr:efflux RND transporter periplasmic adaptor subunit [Planctomycetaceae bacterium]